MLKFARFGLTLGLVTAALVLVLEQADGAALARSMSALPTACVAWMLALMVFGAILASLRLAAIAADVGHPLQLREAVAALSIGQLAGSIFFQLVGQLAARSALLGRHGLPVSATVVMTAYERLIALAVSLTLALFGGWFVFGRVALDFKSGGAEFAELILTGLAVVAAGAAFVWGRAFVAAVTPRLGAHVAYRLSRAATLSTATQLCTMAAYVIGAHALEPVIPLRDVAAASAVVMLAASLPISLAGWGVREMSAVLTLGAIGMPPEEAFVVAAVVGITSLAAVVLLSACTASSWRGAQNLASTSGRTVKPDSIDYAALLSWILPIAAATAVFFQVYAPTTQGGHVNVNFADPVAVIGGTLFLIWAIRDRRWPSWRLSGFNGHVIAATGAVLVSFLIGWASFGLNDWALTNRLLGWFVLLGYGATGALIVSRAGSAGYEALLRTLVVTGIVVAGVDLLLVGLKIVGLDLGLVGLRIDGFAMNPNAFAFQLCMCIAGALVVFRGRSRVAALSVLLMALWCSGSRAGFITILVLGGVAIALRPMLLSPLLKGISIAAAGALALQMVPFIQAELQSRAQVAVHQAAVHAAAPSGAASTQRAETKPRSAAMSASSNPVVFGAFTGPSEASNAERWATIQGGAKLFFGHPIFGAGLGAFVNDYYRETGKVQVVHSTPLWLLAEFGIVGAVIIMLPVLRIFRNEWNRRRAGSDVGFVLILIIVAFGVMSSVHDLMYQRVFWLLLGAGLAVASVELVKRSSEEDERSDRVEPARQLIFNSDVSDCPVRLSA